MKKLGLILSLTMCIVLMASVFCFADGEGLKIEKTYPKDGGTGFQPVNMGVTLYFNEEVSSEDNQEANNKCFKIINKETEEEQEIRVLYHPDEGGKVMVLLKNSLEANTEYVFTVSGDFVADNGDELGEGMTINFKTRDVSKDSMINMLLMVVMFGGMMIFSMKSAKKQQEKEAQKKAGADKVNPYKVAKETGKSVEEIVEQDQKHKAKEAAKQERKARKEAAELAELEAEEEAETASARDINRYHVKTRRTIAEAGSTYITGRKAEAEARRAAGTTRPKNQSAKKKNKKKK